MRYYTCCYDCVEKLELAVMRDWCFAVCAFCGAEKWHEYHTKTNPSEGRDRTMTVHEIREFVEQYSSLALDNADDREVLVQALCRWLHTTVTGGQTTTPVAGDY